MTGHEVTTILSGAPGVPTVIIREPNWREQAEAEREAQRKAETAAEVARIEHDRYVREHAPRPPLAPEDPVAQVHADAARERWLADCREAKKWTPEFIEEQLATEELLIRAMQAQAPPAPDPERKARDRANEYSFGLQASLASAAVCGHGSCMPGRCVYR